MGDELKIIAVNNSNSEEPWYKVEFVANDGTVKTGYVSAADKWYVQDETEANTEAATEASTEASAGK